MGIFKQLRCKHTQHPLKFVQNIYGDEINLVDGRSLWLCQDCGALINRPYLYDSDSVSDGCHTFGELYHHRAVLFSVICNEHKDIAWKSKKHFNPNDEMFEGYFIVGINTPEGQATYHYRVDPYWDMFDVPELYCAPEWDGHDSNEAIRRISTIKSLR